MTSKHVITGLSSSNMVESKSVSLWMMGVKNQTDLFTTESLRSTAVNQPLSKSRNATSFNTSSDIKLILKNRYLENLSLFLSPNFLSCNFFPLSLVLE